jgi:hypothetical protein
LPPICAATRAHVVELGQHLVVDVAGEPAAQFRDDLVAGGEVGVI